MRILLLSHVYPPSIGGVQRSVANLARLLIGRGHAVSVATNDPWGLVRPAAREEGIEVLRLRIPSPFRFRRWSAGPWIDRINRRRLLRWCTRRGVELIHANLINVDTRYAFDVAAQTGAKVVVTLRGGETEQWLDQPYPHPHRITYVRDILGRADAVTAVAAALLDHARALCPSLDGRSDTIPNPVEPERLLELSAGSPTPFREPYLLFVGRLEPMKDVATLIDAAHRLGAGARLPAGGLVLAGGGALAAELQEQSRRGAAAGAIRFLGDAGYAETLGLIRGAAALVLSSRSSEGCPNAVLEAMAFGTPVVLSDLPALRELAADGTAAAVFARGDPAALAEAIVGLAADPIRRADRVRRARERLAAAHEPNAVIARYEAVYERVLAGLPTPSALSSRS